jgi:hypothetical protein
MIAALLKGWALQRPTSATTGGGAVHSIISGARTATNSSEKRQPA